uniref:CCDC174 alpha/beta GRSR domain-containing protein n=1 Tax=Plectus sambesii TaxID=2011161 RepID=A0A914VSK7_9BILA
MPKEINVNVSSLVDLKAELFRKQQQKKQLDGSASGQASKQLFVKGSKKDVLLVTKAEGSKKAQEANDRNGRIRQLEEELRREEEVQRKMKESLANKALLYDRLANGAAVAYGDGEEIEFMVNFDKKARETRRAREEEGDEAEERGGRPSSPLRTPADDDDQWIDYTDSFGRERRCPRNQLAKYIEADLRLARADVAPDRPSTSSTAGSFSDASRRFAEHDDYSQIPVGPVHHANVADNEPREFGVSHFKFDPDEERRRQQMEALEQLRNK